MACSTPLARPPGLFARKKHILRVIEFGINKNNSTFNTSVLNIVLCIGLIFTKCRKVFKKMKMEHILMCKYVNYDKYDYECFDINAPITCQSEKW